MKTMITEEMTKDPITLALNVSISDAQEVMRAFGLRHLPVTSERGLAGVISETDIYRALSAGVSSKTFVAEVMSMNPYAIEKHTSLSEVARVMAENKMGSAIVVGPKYEVIGIFTTTDALYILSRLLDDKDSETYKKMNIGDYLKVVRQSA